MARRSDRRARQPEGGLPGALRVSIRPDGLSAASPYGLSLECRVERPLGAEEVAAGPATCAEGLQPRLASTRAVCPLRPRGNGGRPRARSTAGRRPQPSCACSTRAAGRATSWSRRCAASRRCGRPRKACPQPMRSRPCCGTTSTDWRSTSGAARSPRSRWRWRRGPTPIAAGIANSRRSTSRARGSARGARPTSGCGWRKNPACRCRRSGATRSEQGC